MTRLDQGMGGGKSHACIGAWHLAEHPAEFAKTDIGKAVHKHAADILGRSLMPDLGKPRVVVLPCDSMTPGAPVQSVDGPAKNLWSGSYGGSSTGTTPATTTTGPTSTTGRRSWMPSGLSDGPS